MNYRDLPNDGWGTVRREWLSEIVCGAAAAGRWVMRQVDALLRCVGVWSW